MVGSPGQTVEHLIQDILFIEKLRPEMIGIGPFLTSSGYAFCPIFQRNARTDTALIVYLPPDAPFGTDSIDNSSGYTDSRRTERGILAGANVVMPNLSPQEERKKYTLYNNKASLGAESAEGIRILQQQLHNIGYEISFSRGDFKTVDS